MTAPTITVKRCTKCGETKSVDRFGLDRSKRDGLFSQCKECRRAYHEAHREEKSAYDRAYREAHREERIAYNRAYRKSHREEIRAYQRAYYDVHREEISSYKRAYNCDYNALLGNPTHERWQEITDKHATRSGEPWSEAEDAYLAASTDRIVDDAIALKRTYASVDSRIAHLRKRGIALARDAHRR